MKTKLFMLFLLLLGVMSCQNQGSTNTESQDKQAVGEQNTTTSENGKGKYEIKSGIVVYNTQMMGMAVKQTLTFDDYGKKEISEIAMEMMGTKMQTATLTRDGYVYQLDMMKKTGTKSPVSTMNNANIDFRNLTSEMEKEMNLKKEGKEDFLGKTCEKMSIDYTKMQMKGTFLVYKGVALKMNTTIGTMKMDLVAEKFEENPSISADKFDVPADFTITGQ